MWNKNVIAIAGSCPRFVDGFKKNSTQRRVSFTTGIWRNVPGHMELTVNSWLGLIGVNLAGYLPGGYHMYVLLFSFSFTRVSRALAFSPGGLRTSTWVTGAGNKRLLSFFLFFLLLLRPPPSVLLSKATILKGNLLPILILTPSGNVRHDINTPTIRSIVHTLTSHVPDVCPARLSEPL